MLKIGYRSAIAAMVIMATLPITASASGGKHAEWGYMGDKGPLHWGDLSGDFKMCKEGKIQTPIDIVPNKDVDLPPLKIDYKSASTTLIDNGHTVQVNVAKGSTLTIDGDKYRLIQFHFHVPSENNIEGDAFPLEAHFVHSTDDGKLAVVGVMFEEGDENPILKKIWNHFPSLKRGEEKPCELDAKEISSLLPEKRDYYRFMGSLTTPPCSEGVKWHLFKTPSTVSKEQIVQFFSLFGAPNNRPIQPRNGRTIEE